MPEVDPVQLADLLHGLTRRLRRAQAQGLAPLGLTPAQERALRVITRSTDSTEPLRMAELADRLGIVPRSLTTVVDALEEAGLVRREIDPRNRRAILVRLTDRGAAVRDDLRAARRSAAGDLFAPLDAADRETLAGLLARLDPPGQKDQPPDQEERTPAQPPPPRTPSEAPAARNERTPAPVPDPKDHSGR